MLFSYSWQQVLKGEQTRTRRPVQEGDIAVVDEAGPDQAILEVVRTADMGVPKSLYKVGETYSVSPGRGKRSVGHIVVTAIRRERLQDIAEAEAAQEFPVPAGAENSVERARQKFGETWDKSYPKEGGRWQDNPEVWVVEFNLAGKNITQFD